MHTARLTTLLAAATTCPNYLQVSCDQIKELVRAVRPEVVMVELCKERLGLLVDPENPDRRLETWHCRCDSCVV
jgi:pheromone shutdown protein TraB